MLACRVVETDEFARRCRRCGCEAAPRDSVTRRLAHEPLGWRPTTLLITIRRYRCTGCGHVWRQDTSRAAEPRAKLYNDQAHKLSFLEGARSPGANGLQPAGQVLSPI